MENKLKRIHFKNWFGWVLPVKPEFGDYYLRGKQRRKNKCNKSELYIKRTRYKYSNV